jgi:hypothetical protein
VENATAPLISTKEVEAFMPNHTVNSSILDQQHKNCAVETRVITDMHSNAEYIAQLTNQLYRLASTKKLETLAYILGRVHLEAEVQACKLENRLSQPR